MSTPRYYYPIGCEVWVCIGHTHTRCRFDIVETCASTLAAGERADTLNGKRC